MVRAKALKIVLNGYGSFLGREKGCFIIKDKHGKVQKYPLFEAEIGEIQIKSGNMISSGVLATCGFWGIDVLILTQRGKPIAMLKSLEDESHVKTRICQYEALKKGKGIEIAKTIVYSKIESQNIILRKYGLKQHDLMALKEGINNIESDNLNMVRRKLLPIEGKSSEHYFKQIFQLLPKAIRIENRRGFNAYDGINNTFNLAYEVLKWKIHIALINAKLEPYLGFMHSVQFGKPSLVCDFQELYRYLIDDFIIQYCQKLSGKDFIYKTENYSSKRKGKRQYLNYSQTKDLTEKLSKYFESKVEIARIRHGSKQQIETLINEEALLFAKHLRDEIPSWIPRIAKPL